MRKPVHYLATPYSLFGQGRERAFIEAAQASARLLKRGLLVFSPITHSHPIAEYGAMDPLDHGLWLGLDFAILDQCDELIVIQMPGWRESRGVTAEIEHARKAGKPITYLSWPCLNEREHEGRRDMQ